MRSATGLSKAVPWPWLIGLALLPLPLGSANADEFSMTRTATFPNRSLVTCDVSVQHPIQVRIQALDPIRRGATVRLRLTTTSRVGLASAEARIASPGGAAVLGRSRASLGRMGARSEATADFTFAVPAGADRSLIQFRVEGEGPTGRIGRGATFNLLPDGPGNPARIVAGASGQLVAEYPARRIPR